jgi:hypothetical protein
MDSFFDHRDPLFGIIVFLSLVLIVFCINYYFEYMKHLKENRSLDNIRNSFDIQNDFSNLDVALNSFDLPFETLLFIATAYYKNGDYEKAISILLALLKTVDDQSNKEQVLELLGHVYFKAGFLQRSKDIFLKSLSIYPKNENTLKKLLIIYEMMKDYDSALKVLTPLDELGVDIKKTQVYLETLAIIENPIKTVDEKVVLLKSLLDNYDFLQRIILTFFRQYAHLEFVSYFTKIDIAKYIDLIYTLDSVDIDSVLGNKLLEDIFTANGLFDISDDSEIFELDILIKLKVLNSNNALLSFEYICSSCKHSYPLYQNRCPNCFSILSIDVQPILIDKNRCDYYNTF